MTQPAQTETWNWSVEEMDAVLAWLQSFTASQVFELKTNLLGWDKALGGKAGINFKADLFNMIAASGSIEAFNAKLGNLHDIAPIVPKAPTPEEEPPPTDEDIAGENAYEGWVAWMKDHGLFSAETDALAKQLITEGRDIDWFKRALRETQTYKTAFPEWDMREQAGLLPISEGDILRLRSQYTALTQNYYGYTPNKQQLANLIGQGDKSIDEFEESLQIYKKVEEYGGATQQLFEAIYQVNLSDEDMMEIFRPGGNEGLKKAYAYARYQGLPTLLGFNARSTEEADLLRNAGLTPDEAFQKFQKAGTLSPIMQKLGAIDANVTGNEFLNQVPLETLAKGLVFDFTEEGKQALAEIQRTFAREYARFKKGGGAATDQSGRAVGLVTADQR